MPIVKKNKLSKKYDLSRRNIENMIGEIVERLDRLDILNESPNDIREKLYRITEDLKELQDQVMDYGALI